MASGMRPPSLPCLPDLAHLEAAARRVGHALAILCRPLGGDLRSALVAVALQEALAPGRDRKTRAPRSGAVRAPGRSRRDHSRKQQPAGPGRGVPGRRPPSPRSPERQLRGPACSAAAVSRSKGRATAGRCVECGGAGAVGVREQRGRGVIHERRRRRHVVAFAIAGRDPPTLLARQAGGFPPSTGGD